MAKSTRVRMPTTAPFRFAPPLVDARLVDVTRDRGRDLSPWAAYSLGYEVGTAPENLVLARTVPQLGGECFDAIRWSASVVRLAVDVLSPVVPTGVAAQIREAVNDLEEFNNSASYRTALIPYFDLASCCGGRESDGMSPVCPASDGEPDRQ